MAARRGAGPENNEEFLQHLYKGGELLAAGKVIEAKDYLERAHEMAPKNEKGQNLLGLTYFKLGLFERAAEIYEMLVRDNPVDPTLRVNLGLVYLKTNQLARAIREFETSVDLAPEHKKAHNYLGLALAQAGNLAQAREHFIQAGSDAMVQKMDRALSGEATGLHRMPAPLEQQKQGFAEIEGSEVVTERGGQPVVDEARLRGRNAADSAAASVEAHPVDHGMDEGPPVAEEIQVEDTGGGPAEVGSSPGDWGAHFSGEDADAASVDGSSGSGATGPVDGQDALSSAGTYEAAAPSGVAEATAFDTSATVGGAQDDEIRFAEDEGPGWPATAPAEPAASPQAQAHPEESFADVDVDGSGEASAASGTGAVDGFAAVGAFADGADTVSYEQLPEAQVDEQVMTPEDLGADVESTSSISADRPPFVPRSSPAVASSGFDDAFAGAEAHAAEAPPFVPTPVPGPPNPDAWEARPLTELKSEEALGPPLIELAPALQVFTGAVGAPFEVRPEGAAAVSVQGELLTRVDGLVLVSGAVQFEPELKRFRGRMTDQPFGTGAARMMRAVGQGVLLVQAGGAERRFVAVDLADESAYFRDEVVYAFEEAVVFENGRVPSENAGDLDLVHLRGKGKVLLQLEGVLRTHPVRLDMPVTVPLRRLVGWFGNVTPKVHALAFEENGQLIMGGAELTGEGHVLLSVPTFSGRRQER